AAAGGAGGGGPRGGGDPADVAGPAIVVPHQQEQVRRGHPVQAAVEPHRFLLSLTSRAPVGRAGSHLLGHVPGIHEAHELVPEIGGRREHQRAASVNHRDAVRPALARGGGGGTARAAATVPPHLLHAELGALPHG